MEEFKDMFKDVNFCLRCGHKLTVKEDRESKERPHCDNCGWIYYKNPIPAAACVVINNENQLLLVKRKFEPKANEWALPSGYIELWQSPQEAAVEELKEETGLIGEVHQFIDYYTGSSPIYLRIISFGYLMKINGGILQAGDDALEARFFSKEELPPIAFKSHKHFLNKLNYI